MFKTKQTAVLNNVDGRSLLRNVVSGGGVVIVTRHFLRNFTLIHVLLYVSFTRDRCRKNYTRFEPRYMNVLFKTSNWVETAHSPSLQALQ